jgi:hypothetical protein
VFKFKTSSPEKLVAQIKDVFSDFPRYMATELHSLFVKCINSNFTFDQHFMALIKIWHFRLQHTSAVSGEFCSSSGPLHTFHWNHPARANSKPAR